MQQVSCTSVSQSQCTKHPLQPTDTASSASSQAVNLVDRFALCSSNGTFFITSDFHMFCTMCSNLPFSFPTVQVGHDTTHSTLCVFQLQTQVSGPRQLKKMTAGNDSLFTEGFFLSVVRETRRQLSPASRYVNMQCYIERNRKK